MSGGWNTGGDGPQGADSGGWWGLPAMAVTFGVIGLAWFGPAFYLIEEVGQPWKLAALLWLFAFPYLLYLCAPAIEGGIDRIVSLFARSAKP